MIGLGVVTYNNPLRYQRCMSSLFQQLSDVVDVWAFYEDGSLAELRRPYLAVSDALEDEWGIPNLTLSDGTNRGVAYAKNQLLTALLASDATDFFLVEDDMLCLSPKAVTEYVRVAHYTGLGHLSYARRMDRLIKMGISGWTGILNCTLAVLVLGLTILVSVCLL